MSGSESLMDVLVENRVCARSTCDGSSECQAVLHIHGCFSDDGNCDDPEEHDWADVDALLWELP